MTEPQPVMAQAEQDQLTRRVGRSLLTVAGEGWQRVRAEYRSAGRHIEVDVLVTGPDGAEHPVRPPQEVVEGLGRLRQGMYRPGRGTWLSGVYLLEPPSSFSAEFEPDAEPRWRRVPPPIGFADELKFFPRADEHIPDWLRQRVGLPPLRPAEDQNAGGAPNAANQPQQGQPQPGQPQPGQSQPSGQAQPGGPQPGGQPPPGGQPTPPPGTPAPPPQFGGVPAGPFSGQPPRDPRHGGEPTPPPGIPAGPFPPPQAGNEPRFGARAGEPTPPPGIPASQPSPRFGTQQTGEPTPPRGIPATETAPPPFGTQRGGEPTPPPGIPANGPAQRQFGGEPTPPPGIPANGPAQQFGGQPFDNPTPGNPVNETPPPQFGGQPFDNQSGGQITPPANDSWFGAQENDPPRGFGVPATPFPPEERR